MSPGLALSGVLALAPTEAPTETEPSGAEGKTPPSKEAIARQNEADIEGATRPSKWTRSGSPQRFEVEFKIGPYLPAVDRKYTGTGLGPYATIFGPSGSDGIADDEPRPGVMPVIAFEWQFIYLAGPLGIGTQIGFFGDRAQALVTNPAAGESVRSNADEVRFGMVPIATFLVYRFEYLADRFKVPLVPYAKAGPGYAFWWSRSGNGNLSRNSQGEIGRGGVWGWQVSAGGMLRLDFIEPGTAGGLDKSTGINHFYLFGEFQFSRLDNFGIGDAIALGDATWFAGLAMEF